MEASSGFTKGSLMLLTRSSRVQTPENANYAYYLKKRLQEVFSMVHGVSSNMNLIGRLGVTQSDVHSHLVVELSAVESSM